jgi:hypothetical protein
MAEIGSCHINLTQREVVLVWHAHGMPEQGCAIVIATEPASAGFFVYGLRTPRGYFATYFRLRLVSF